MDKFCYNRRCIGGSQKKCAEVTHNHPYSIQGAQAVVAAIYLARKGSTKEEIKSYITTKFSKL